MCANCIFGTIAKVNVDDGAKLRSYPYVPPDGGSYLTVLPKDTNVFVLSPFTYGGSGYKWRMVGYPWKTAAQQGFVVDDFIESVCQLPWPNCPPRDDGGGGPGPDPELSAFRLGQFFKTPYRIINEYGSGEGGQSWLPDLGREGHNGVDVVPVPEPPVTDDNRCQNNVEGREVIAPVDGSMIVANPDGSTPYPETNPSGVTLIITQIPNYPRLEIQLTHVDTDLSSGMITAGSSLGYYAQIGNSTWPHLHISLKKGGSILNVQPYLP